MVPPEARMALTKEAEGRAALSEADLVQEVRRGNADAFEVLVRRHLPAAHGLAMSLVADSDAADDICQDGFILALERIGQLREPDRFRSWLLSIVRNRALNVRAAESRKDASGIDPAGIAIEAAGPDADLEWKELEEGIHQATESLTAMQKSVFLLHDMEGMNHREIADSLGISKGSSRVHLHMARRAVKNRLNGFLPEEV